MTASPNLVVTATATDVTITIKNPVSNAYAVTSVSVFAPSGWTLTGLFGACGATGLTTLSAGATSGGFTCTGTLSPGFSTTITAKGVTGPASPATSAPPSGAFTTAFIDGGSSPASYAGPSFTEWSIASTTVSSVTPGATTYTAGASSITVTATLSSGQPSVPVVWSFSNGAYPTSTLSNGNSNPGGTLSPSSGTTGSSGTASTTFAPSDFKTDATTVVATLGTSAITGASGTITTAAAAPASVTVSVGGDSDESVVYVTANAASVYATGDLWATVAATGISGSVVDTFGNAIAAASITTPGCTLTAFGGNFKSGSSQLSTDSPTSGGASCTTSGVASNDLVFYQGSNYGTTTKVTITITGTYGGNSFTASGQSATISTSAFDGAIVNGWVAAGVNGLTTSSPATNGGTVSAGSASGTPSAITVTYQLAVAQSGVKVTFLGVNTTAYSGSFVGGTAPFHRSGEVAGAQPANVTATSTVSSGTATATATFTVDTTLGHAVTFKAQIAAPTTEATSAILGPSTATAAYTTGAGTVSKFGVSLYYATGNVGHVSKSIPGNSLYVDIWLLDFFGNNASNPGQQYNLALTTTPTGAASFTSSSVYISSGSTHTGAGGSFGPILMVLSSSVAPAGTTVTITASGFYSGTGSVAIVSANPTIKVSTPSGTVGHTVYSNAPGVGFSGTAAPSTGYGPAGSVPTISSVSYTVDGGSATTASGTTSWSFGVTLANGLHTIAMYATDSNKANSATNSTIVLVDTSAPTITAPSTLAYGAGTPVAFTIVDSEGDLNAPSVAVTTNSTATLTTTVTGTNNPGSSVTYTVSISGLPASTGHWKLTVNAKDLAGNAATAVSAVVQVTVQQAQSLVIQGTPTSGTVGNYQGVTVSYQNVWSSSQNVVVFAVWKNSLGQTVYISAASYNMASGATQTGIFLPEVGLASGTYTVSLFVWTTTNTSVSVTSTVTVTF